MIHESVEIEIEIGGKEIERIGFGVTTRWAW